MNEPKRIMSKPIDDCAEKLAAFFKDGNVKTSREAQIAFALVDWVEPEVDPDTIEGKYLECLYQAGIHAGFRTLDDLSEPTINALGLWEHFL